MRRDAGHFRDQELELVQLSRRLREARRVEELLDEAGYDYLLEAAPYRATLLFVIPVSRVGVYFYVRPDEAVSCREVLAAAGLPVVEVLDED
jgi:hypothetical protein